MRESQPPLGGVFLSSRSFTGTRPAGRSAWIAGGPNTVCSAVLRGIGAVRRGIAAGAFEKALRQESHCAQSRAGGRAKHAAA